MGRCDEGVHPPVCAFRQQIDEWLEKADSEVLQVFGGLQLSGVREEHIALEHKSSRRRTGEDYSHTTTIPAKEVIDMDGRCAGTFASQ